MVEPKISGKSNLNKSKERKIEQPNKESTKNLKLKVALSYKVSTGTVKIHEVDSEKLDLGYVDDVTIRSEGDRSLVAMSFSYYRKYPSGIVLMNMGDAKSLGLKEDDVVSVTKGGERKEIELVDTEKYGAKPGEYDMPELEEVTQEVEKSKPKVVPKKVQEETKEQSGDYTMPELEKATKEIEAQKPKPELEPKEEEEQVFEKEPKQEESPTAIEEEPSQEEPEIEDAPVPEEKTEPEPTSKEITKRKKEKKKKPKKKPEREDKPPAKNKSMKDFESQIDALRNT